MPGPPLSPGTLLAGRFLLGEPLGRGGTAVVYRGEDQVLRVPRAIKVLDGGWTPGREQLRKRLRDEARAMARLRHPHVLAVHDVGEVGELDYVVMDLAPGGSLAQRVDRDGPLPPAEAVARMGEVLDALQVAHSHGLVHRDVKPQNILLDADGRALLADFGIARMNEEESTRSTRSGVAMGSLAYMAPEQRVDARTVTPAADVYAAGATLFHLLTGANPVDLFMAGPESARLEGVPEGLRPVVVTATRYEPERRHASAEAMAAALRDALAAPPPVPVPAAPARGRARPVGLGVAALLGVALAIGLWTEAGEVPAPPAPAGDAAPVPAEPPRLAEVVMPPTSDAGLPASPPRRSAPAATPAPVPEAPFGTWRGSINGLVTTFTFDGTPDAVDGRVTTTRAGASVAYGVVGRFDPELRTLTLVDRVDDPGAGEYTLTLDPTSRRFSGSFVRKSDGTRVVVQGFR